LLLTARFLFHGAEREREREREGEALFRVVPCCFSPPFPASA